MIKQKQKKKCSMELFFSPGVIPESFLGLVALNIATNLFGH